MVSLGMPRLIKQHPTPAISSPQREEIAVSTPTRFAQIRSIAVKIIIILALAMSADLLLDHSSDMSKTVGMLLLFYAGVAWTMILDE